MVVGKPFFCHSIGISQCDFAKQGKRRFSHLILTRFVDKVSLSDKGYDIVSLKELLAYLLK
jgi:hypothetical protein